MKKIQMFCLPYAGGNASFYYQFNKYLDEQIELVPIELKGHGSRIMENTATSMDELVDDALSEILKYKEDLPYALFGYSMGTNICYELYHKLCEKIHQEPLHVFFAANTPPHDPEDERDCHTWSDEDFIKMLTSYGGVSKEMLEEKELWEIFIPILRAQNVKKLNCDISVFYSEEDNKKNNMDEWEGYTQSVCRFYSYEGKHFFILDKVKDVVSIINETLK